jgi:hypothetical protein
MLLQVILQINIEKTSQVFLRLKSQVFYEFKKTEKVTKD